MQDALVKFLIVFFVVVEPLSLVPLFASFTEGAQPGYRVRMAVKAVLISFAILALFAFGGAWFIDAMGIEYFFGYRFSHRTFCDWALHVEAT